MLSVVHQKGGKHKGKEKGGEEETEGMVAVMKDDNLEEIDQKDDGYIELVLRVLARMCDGQHKGLQVFRLIYYANKQLHIYEIWTITAVASSSSVNVVHLRVCACIIYIGCAFSSSCNTCVIVTRLSKCIETERLQCAEQQKTVNMPTWLLSIER